MPRPRKTMKFANVLDPLSIADLKTLKEEVGKEIRAKEREISKAKSEQDAQKIRDKIKIGSKVSFKQRGAGGGTLKTQVIGIFADKVQVVVDGRKRSIALTRITAVD